MNILALALAASLANPDATVSVESDAFVAGGASWDGAKTVAIELTPLGLFVGHYGASIEVVPAAHHGIVLSGFYLSTSNRAPSADSTAPPITNTWRGLGGELGYRYYFGARGPHGLYLGPSLLAGSYHGAGYDFRDLGGALDVGYQAILGPAIIGLSAGAQYVHVDHDIPEQGDLYADVHVRSAVRPRAGLTVGVAF